MTHPSIDPHTSSTSPTDPPIDCSSDRDWHAEMESDWVFVGTAPSRSKHQRPRLAARLQIVCEHESIAPSHPMNGERCRPRVR